jgi:uncharacterized protein (DUF58 family)
MPSSRLFDRYVPLLLLALTLAGAYAGLLALVTVAATLLFTLLVTRAWSRHSLRALSYERETGDERAFPGDELPLSLRLTNAKLLPLPWVEVDDRVPERLQLLSEDGEPASTLENGRLRLGGSVSWSERVTWRYLLRCRRRGIYRLGPATITSGDPFGFFPQSSPAGDTRRIVVYPRLVPLDGTALPSGSPHGDTRAPQWLFEEPTRVVGVRDYRPEDPVRRIHWKATARRATLQVKIHEPTVELSTVIVLAVDSFGAVPPAPGSEDGADEPFEQAVSLAASLAHLLIGRGVPVGMYANWGGAGSSSSLQLPPAGGQEQLLQVLEALAAVEAAPCCSLEAFLAELAPRLPWGVTVMVIAGDPPRESLAALELLGRTGRKVVVFPVGEAAGFVEGDSVRVQRVHLAPARPHGVGVSG